MTWQNEVESLFRKLKPVLGKQIDSLWLAYNTQTDSRSRAEILGILWSLASKYLDETYDKKILLSLPEKDVIAGEYELGKVIYGDKEYYPFGLRENEWLRHTAIFGATGSGKTNLAFILLRNLVKTGKPWLVLDWKRNYRDLLAFEEFKDTKIYTIGREISPLSFNPLIPPENTNPRAWLKKLSEVLAHAYFLGEGVLYLLQNAIDKAYSDYGVYSGTNEYPTFKDVLSVLEKMQVKGRKALWMDSTLRTLGVLCFGEFSKVLNTRKSYPIADLLNENVILELDALTNSDKTFFIEALLLWIHHYRLSEKDREVFKHAILIEEAHHILLKKKQEQTGSETIMEIILREIRELSTSVTLLDQCPSLISLPALANTYTTICFGLKHKADMRTISESLLLENDQIDFLGQLETGTAIVKLQGRYFKPFLVRFPLFPIKKGNITDSDIKRPMRSYSGERGTLRHDPGNRGTIREIQGDVKEEEIEITLTDVERGFLKDIAKNPISGVVARYERIGINRYQGNKTQNSLLEKGFISWRPVSIQKGRIKVLVLTDKGKMAIPDVKVLKIFQKNESWNHAYWKFKIGEHYQKKAYRVTFEFQLGQGKSVDLMAEKGEKRIAIEIETGKSDAVYNVRKCLEAGFNEISIVTLNEKMKEKIIEKLKEIPPVDSQKINVFSANNFQN